MQIVEVFFLVFIGSIVGIFFLFIYWNILHVYLTRKYDPILFKAPYFNSSELGAYSVWPFSLVKTTGYILLITNMPIAKKRFKSLETPIRETAAVKLLCYFWEISFVVFGGIFVVGIIFSAVNMFFTNSQ